jgi:hypothetical protein
MAVRAEIGFKDIRRFIGELFAEDLRFVNGDSSSSLSTAPTVSPATAATANAGIYNGTLTTSDAANDNYTISYAAGNLTILR